MNLQGAKVAAPDRPAVAYVGDGAWGMSLNEMLTCVRENIPTVAVVFNNRQWGAEKKNQVKLELKDEKCAQLLCPSPNF